MRFTEEKLSEINDALESNTRLKDKDYEVMNGVERIGLYRHGWHICDLDELSNTIRELVTLREIIADKTGRDL